MAAYPATLPGPVIEGLGARVAMGVLRSDMDTHQAQRRVFQTMPHSFTLVFRMTLVQWAQWQLWALADGYRWFELDLPSLYAGRVALPTSPLLVRFTSSFAATLLAGDVVQVTVTAETDLNTDAPQVAFTEAAGIVNADLTVGVDVTGAPVMSCNWRSRRLASGPELITPPPV